ncbi:spore coat protein [Anaerovorax odorimutans]|uniref:spore coat protein n=1 Tax=Anaerovorax odorimutans TaxID=109327 RepID=UPI000424760F|nr:spore coat protein [Anaerovorax odorimutans]
MNTLTQKEITLLQDEKKNEEICVEKYNKYASQASNPQLKTLFQELSGKEQEHYNTINQILNGTVPNMNSNQSNQQQSQSNSQTQTQPQMQPQAQNISTTNPQQDSYLCTDALSTEKYVSSSYNTAIFEFKDPNIRQALNHIQKEEQEHGEKIYNYMAQNGLYN